MAHLPPRMCTSAAEPKVGRKARRVVGSCSHAVKEEMAVGSAVSFLRVRVSAPVFLPRALRWSSDRTS